jgi:hypothetical protein
MRLRLEAKEGEIAEKGPELVKALLTRLAPHSPQCQTILEALEKAETAPPSKVRHPAMRGLDERASAIYAEQMTAMLKEIEAILDAAPHA